MPTYVYECQICGSRFEKYQGMNEAKLKECPKCKGVLRRLIGKGTGIIFKGAGFHCVDYRTNDYRSNEEREASFGGDEDK